ncbi:hypothetical protein LWI29_003447 [Acer saccharum]|uniref:Uncharacterized protein n=1 Tax=Acer saccharum TaxID=4024 RepID=A0AA39VFE2_ACESA|nr:hypothetical protein LWI29_003447 [Acer saccharum]
MRQGIRAPLGDDYQKSPEHGLIQEGGAHPSLSKDYPSPNPKVSVTYSSSRSCTKAYSDDYQKSSELDLTQKIISGKKNRGFFHDDPYSNLIQYMWELWRDGKALEMVDSCINDSCPANEVMRCIQVGLLCVQDNTKDRPSMSTVVFMLSNETVLPSPKKSSFPVRNSKPNSSIAGTKCSINDVTNTSFDGEDGGADVGAEQKFDEEESVEEESEPSLFYDEICLSKEVFADLDLPPVFDEEIFDKESMSADFDPKPELVEEECHAAKVDKEASLGIGYQSALKFNNIGVVDSGNTAEEHGSAMVVRLVCSAYLSKIRGRIFSNLERMMQPSKTIGKLRFGFHGVEESTQRRRVRKEGSKDSEWF